MYNDPILWEKIRRKYYIDKTFKRELLRDEGIGWETLKKILEFSQPPGYRLKEPRPKPMIGAFLERIAQILEENKTLPKNQRLTAKRIYERIRGMGYRGKYTQVKESVRELFRVKQEEISLFMNELVKSAVKEILEYLPYAGKNNSLLESLSLRLHQCGYCPNEMIGRNAPESVDFNWMRKLIQGVETLPNSPNRLKNSKDGLSTLLNRATNGTLKDRNRAVAVLAHLRGISRNRIAKFLCVSKSPVNRYLRIYKICGAEKMFDYSKPRVKKSQDTKTREMFFSILHSPPSMYNINRTTWKMADLRKVLANHNMPLCKDVIREIIRSEGYRWRNAKVVLTSNDPLFREKISRIKTILSTLGDHDRFFSIDEFGPFSIRMKPGRRLVAPNETPTVPQFQKSKGFLIITAALELSQNQITHFYSKKKIQMKCLSSSNCS